MSGLRLAIFDMDGTLMDSQDFIIRAMQAAFAEFEMTAPPRADILSIVGLSLFEAVQPNVFEHFRHANFLRDIEPSRRGEADGEVGRNA